MKSAVISVFVSLLCLAAFSPAATIPTPLPSKAVNVTVVKETEIQRLQRQVNNLKRFVSCFDRVMLVSTVTDSNGVVQYVQGDATNSDYVPTLKEKCVG